jgi:hypothetical protein
VETIIRESSIWPVAWLLLLLLSRFTENWEQKAECKDLKNMQFEHQRSAFKIADKEGMVGGLGA